MMQLLNSSLVCQRPGRRVVELEVLEVNYKVRAMVQMGIGGDTARVFSFSGGERGKIISLAQRKGVIV